MKDLPQCQFNSGEKMGIPASTRKGKFRGILTLLCGKQSKIALLKFGELVDRIATSFAVAPGGSTPG